METNDIIVGLDIGTTKICTIVGKKNEFGKIDILGYGKSESLGVTRGVVTNIVNTIESIKMSVQEASGRSNVEIGNVYVGIAGQHIKKFAAPRSENAQLTGDEISQTDIDAIVEDMYKLAMPPGRRNYSRDPSGYIVDSEQELKSDRDVGYSSRSKLPYHHRPGYSGKNIYKCVNRAGLHTEGLFLEPLLPSEAVLTDEEKRRVWC